jgi:antitoxin PrlF
MGIKATTTLTSKGQMTLPKAVRDRLGVKPGDRLDFVEDDDGFRVVKVRIAHPLDKWIGFLTELEGRDPDELIEDWRGR